MSLTKRVRFEVLRRDNHTCRYCGASAPDVKLTVDHVVPKALGGTDETTNLVTACQPCNSGKSSMAPDASVVADVRQDALRHAEMTRQAYAVLAERLGDRGDYADEWLESWSSNLPADWRNTINRWFDMGVPLVILQEAADVACSRRMSDHGRFAYMCGIVWRQIEMVDTVIEAKRHLDGAFMSTEALESASIDGYQIGHEAGLLAAQRAAARNDPLSIVVDHIDYPAGWWS